MLIFFTVLSNLRLLRMPWFYAAGFLGALLFMPHLYWQYLHDFPSFRYHLKGRDDVYELKYTLTYLLNQLVLFSPLLLPYLLLAFFKLPFTENLQRSYRMVALGFWFFFLWSTSKGHVEPQWTSLLSIPLVLLLFAEEKRKAFSSKSLITMGLLSGALLLGARVGLLFAWGPLGKNLHNKTWIMALQQKIGDEPVIFHNTYRDPALYSFYTGRKAYELTTAEYRKSQYDLWDDEVALQGKSVYLVTDRNTYCPDCDRLSFGKIKLLGIRLLDFQVAEKITLEVLKAPKTCRPGDSIQVLLKLHNPYPFSVDPQRGTFRLKPGVAFHRAGQVLWIEDCILQKPSGVWQPDQDYFLEVSCRVPAKFRGKLDLVFGLRYRDLQPTLAGDAVELSIKR